MTLQAHQIRVVEEKAALDVKIEALRNFFHSPIFTGLPEAERIRLQTQQVHMSAYSAVLGERIEAF